MPEITVIPPFIPPHEVIRVGAYCRVSTESGEQMHSFAAQKAHFSALFAGSQTHRLAVVYADAFTTDRIQTNKRSTAEKHAELRHFR